MDREALWQFNLRKLLLSSGKQGIGGDGLHVPSKCLQIRTLTLLNQSSGVYMSHSDLCKHIWILSSVKFPLVSPRKLRRQRIAELCGGLLPLSSGNPGIGHP